MSEPTDLPAKIAARILVDDITGCWLWQGVQNGRGYGQVHWNGRMRYVHRVAYELLVGPIALPELDHVAERGCAYKHCCNPLHLEPVTHQENLRRALATTECPNGHAYPTADRRCLVCRRERDGWKGGPPMAERTHCPHGHEYTPENTRVYQGRRFCKACAAKRSRPPARAAQ